MNLNHIVDTLDTIVIAVDDGWRYNYVNAYTERMIGRRADELLGNVLWECFPQFNGTEFERHCRSAMDTRAPLSFETAGAILPGEHRVSIYPSGTGLAIMMAASRSQREIDEEVLRESERSARSTLDGLSAHIATLDTRGNVLAANRAWREAPPASSPSVVDAVTGNYLAHCDTIDGPYARALADGIRAVIDGGEDELSIEFPVDGPDRQRWFITRVTRFPGRDTRVIVAHEEITELRHTQLRLQRRERELQRQREVSSTIAHRATEALFLMDHGGRITFVNRAAEEMFGWPEDELIGKVLHDTLHYRHADGTPFSVTDCPISAVLFEGATVHNHEDIFYTKDGSPVHVSCSNAPIADDRPTGGITLVVRDISEHKQTNSRLRDTEERYRLVARATNDVIWDWDLLTDTLLWNEAIETAFGYDLENRITDSGWWSDRIHPDDRQRVLAGINEAIAGDGHCWSEEYRFQTGDGSYATVFDRGYAQRDEDGNAVRMIGAMLDLTQRKEAEQTLQRAKEEAEAANRAKDQFIAVMSHELRTPLTPALAAIQVLEESGIAEDVRPFLEIIRRNIELEARLIDDLLDLTRIAKGKLELHPEIVDLHTVIANVVETCQSDINEKKLLLGQTLRAGQHHVWGDSARLHQVLWNILKNAIKFTPRHGTISIVTGNDDGQIHVEVTDNGIGIEQNVLSSIFDAFIQGEQRINRQFGGLGLGLAITRSLLEMHEGTISASSEGAGRGATFRVGLPTAPPLEQPIDDNGDTMIEDDGRAQIMLVDDHPDTLEVIKIILERRGMRVHTAISIASALELASRQRFDLLVSDIGLPDGTGHDLIRKLSAVRPVRAIAMSGFGMDEDVQNSLDAGFEEHLVKPVNIRKLQETIARLLSIGDR